MLQLFVQQIKAFRSNGHLKNQQPNAIRSDGNTWESKKNYEKRMKRKELVRFNGVFDLNDEDTYDGHNKSNNCQKNLNNCWLNCVVILFVSFIHTHTHTTAHAANWPAHRPCLRETADDKEHYSHACSLPNLTCRQPESERLRAPKPTKIDSGAQALKPAQVATRRDGAWQAEPRHLPRSACKC